MVGPPEEFLEISENSCIRAYGYYMVLLSVGVGVILRQAHKEIRPVSPQVCLLPGPRLEWAVSAYKSRTFRMRNDLAV